MSELTVEDKGYIESGTREEEIRRVNPSRPRLYDLKFDCFRFATQEDVDLLMKRCAEHVAERDAGRGRGIIQILLDISGYLMLLCDDGTVWRRGANKDWVQVNTDEVTTRG